MRKIENGHKRPAGTLLHARPAYIGRAGSFRLDLNAGRPGQPPEVFGLIGKGWPFGRPILFEKTPPKHECGAARLPLRTSSLPAVFRLGLNLERIRKNLPAGC